MSERDKIKDRKLSDFQRYRENKMTAEERNFFERSLQKDPFAGEASEGFEDVDAGIIEKDIASLRSRLKKRTSDRRKVILYRVAASVAVLMILASALIIIERKKPAEQLAYAPSPAHAPAVPPSAKEIHPIADSNIEFKALKEKEVRTAVPVKKESIKPKVEPGKTESKPVKEEKFREEAVAVVSQDAAQAARQEVNEEPMAKGRAMAARVVRLAGDTSIKMNFDTAAASLNEVVVVGYGRKQSENNKEPEGYLPPQPLGGKASFDKYVEKNIRRPDSSAVGQRVVVVLNFNVDTDGRIDSISVIRSPGKPFSEEAIRLIKDGPAWQPAQEDGKAIRDQVRIRIIFK
ncbi:MAG: TonB family protein [Bacteroidota bacterium]|nr:TonB family protein [Bacteroidota bacterium]